MADSPMGQVTVEFAPVNEFGVIDHVVRMPSGEAVYNAMRVIPAGSVCPAARWCSRCGSATG